MLMYRKRRIVFFFVTAFNVTRMLELKRVTNKKFEREKCYWIKKQDREKMRGERIGRGRELSIMDEERRMYVCMYVNR